MANKYFRSSGNTNYSTATNWSTTDGGAADTTIPTAADDVFFTVNSGNCIINTTGLVARSMDFTGFTGTFTMTNAMIMSGNLTLGSSMTTAGTAILSINVAGTIRSNGKTWTPALNIVGAANAVTTLLEDFTIIGALTIGNGAKIINGFTISVRTFIVNGNLTGTTKVIVQGSPTISGTGMIGVSLTINSGGTVTFSGNVTIGNGMTLLYTAGTVATAGSTLEIVSNATLNTAGINWNNVSVTADATITLDSAMNIVGSLTFSNNAVSFAGAFGWTVPTLNTTPGAFTITLASNVTYRVTSTAQILTSVNSSATIRSGTANVRAILDIPINSVIAWINFIDIRSANIIKVFGGNITNTINILQFSDPYKGIAKSIAA